MRWKFFIPALVIIGGLVVFYAFGMDAVAARGMEKALEKIFNARAEVSGLDISLIKGRTRISHISVADEDNPMSNLFELGEIVMDTPVKALLMGRFVIEEASIRDISWNTPRKTSGALKKAESKSTSAKTTDEKKPLISGEDVIAVGNDYFESQKEMFKSPKLAEEAAAKAEELKSKWAPKIDGLSAEIKKAESAAEEIKKIDTDSLKTLDEIALALKALRDNSEDIKEAVDSVRSVKDEFENDKAAVQKLKKELTAAREADWQIVSQQLNVPVESRFQSFTQDILSGVLHKKLGSFAKYIEKGVEVMAKMKEQEKKKAPPKAKKERFKGRNVIFKSMIFPKFHLKHAVVSVKKEDLFIEGELVNFRTAPEQSENPATFKLEGSHGRGDIKISGIIDNRKQGEEKSKLFFRGRNFPLTDKDISIPYVRLDSFSGICDVDIDYLAEVSARPELGVKISIRDMKVSGEEKDFVTGIVIDAVRTTPELLISGKMTIGGPAVFSSNFDNILSKKLKEHINAEIAASQKKAREAFDAYIGGYEKDAFAALDAFKDPYEARINNLFSKVQSYDKVADFCKKEIEDRKKELQDKEADKLKDKAKDLFKNLR